MARKTKPPRAGRPKTSRSRKRRVLVATNGRVTEAAYFDLLRSCFDDATFHRLRGLEGKSPLELVDAALSALKADADESKRRSSDACSVAFVVTDTDRFTDLAKAERRAKDSKAHLILSNPCFEVWLIDHVTQCPNRSLDAKPYEKLAHDLGITAPPSAKRGTSRSKAIVEKRITPLDESLKTAMENARGHCTQEKLKVRESDPDKTSDYVNWTDMTRVIEWLEGRHA
ncbi:MAG: RloB family protein [Olsenella sp.]|jgi:hypothetical protein|nr:RloB family protein [Olsenella sp.]MCI1289833.1 RloB family protein [Olsenella sp.]